MKKIIILFLICFVQICVYAQELTLSDVQNSGCMHGTRARANENEKRRTIILTKEGNILTVQLLGYEATCDIEDFIITPSVIDGSPCSVIIKVEYIDNDEDCICPYNISFTIHELESSSFRFSCWWYNGLVNLTEGEALVLEDIKENISIDGTIYTLDKVALTAKLIRKGTGESEVDIPSELSYEGQKYTVTGIGSYVFHSNAALTSITIPGSITYIGEAAFYGCSNLKEVCCQADDAPGTGSWVFDNTPIASATLHVPAGSVDKYKTTYPWSDFGNIVALPIEINETTFPDENFRTWVLAQSYGQDGMLTDEEIVRIKEINVISKSIKSLKGIEFFTELTNLDCSWNQLPLLDVSKNTALKELNCQGNQLTELNLLKNIELEDLACNYNQLTSLDVSQNTALAILACIENQLTELDLSRNNLLKRLVCPYNQLTSINVSGCTALESFRCAGNKLAELDVSGCPALEDLICMSNQIKGEAMDALVESLPTVNRGHLGVINHTNEQNVMTKSQVAVAKAKGWYVQYNDSNNQWKNYEGSDEPVTFTAGQIATIILPTNPDASKGKYYRLDRYEDGQIIFEQELQPQAHIPYIIVPNEDFSINLSALDLAGCYRDTVSIAGISFIGSYVSETFDYPDGFYIDFIDITSDCQFNESCVIGALRAYLLVRWDDPYNQGGTRVPPLNKRGIVLRDYGTGITSPLVETGKGTAIYNLAGQRLSKPQKGIYIENGKKIAAK